VTFSYLAPDHAILLLAVLQICCWYTSCVLQILSRNWWTHYINILSGSEPFFRS